MRLRELDITILDQRVQTAVRDIRQHNIPDQPHVPEVPNAAT